MSTVLELPTPDPASFDDTSRPFAQALSATYAVKRLIGRGGMGAVYLARDRRLDRLVAIKTLLPQLAADASVRERFLRETRTVGAMSHPNIVPIHGADEIDGHVFFVMGYVNGESLAAHIRAHHRLEPEVVARYLRDVAAALAHAHGRGIIHRDIKAENILIDRDRSSAVVTDFGIARLAEAGPLTATGQLLGTVYYVSPEQIAGEPVDARSDLYSLGVVGFLALTGTFPFDAELASAVLVSHVTKHPPAVAAVRADAPRALAAIIDRCLAKDPAHRHTSASELVAELDRVIVEIAHAPPAAERPRMVSDIEAQAVWQRAAELQASTGTYLPPASSGMHEEDVRMAARGAGIATKYIDRALVEQRASETPKAVGVQHPGSRWMSSAADIVVEATIDRQLRRADFERAVELIREWTGEVGEAPARTRELFWQAKWFGHTLRVWSTPGSNGTVTRVRMSVRRAVIAANVGAIGLVGLVGGGVAGGIIHDMIMLSGGDAGRAIANQVGLGIWAVIGVASFPLARALTRIIRRRATGSVRALTEALVRQADGRGEDGERPE